MVFWLTKGTGLLSLFLKFFFSYLFRIRHCLFQPQWLIMKLSLFRKNLGAFVLPFLLDAGAGSSIHMKRQEVQWRLRRSWHSWYERSLLSWTTVFVHIYADFHFRGLWLWWFLCLIVPRALWQCTAEGRKRLWHRNFLVQLRYCPAEWIEMAALWLNRRFLGQGINCQALKVQLYLHGPPALILHSSTICRGCVQFSERTIMSLNNITWFIFVIEVQWIYCEVEN